MGQLPIDGCGVWPQLEEPLEAVQVPGAVSMQGWGSGGCAGIQQERAAVLSATRTRALHPSTCAKLPFCYALCFKQ